MLHYRVRFVGCATLGECPKTLFVNIDSEVELSLIDITEMVEAEFYHVSRVKYVIIEGLEAGEIVTDEPPCSHEGNHEYSEHECVCGQVFCYSCCSSTNVDQGGKYTPDYMLCPSCQRDLFEEI